MGARTILWLSLSGQACFRMLLVIRELSTSQFPLLGNTIWGKMYKNNRRSTCNQPHPLCRLLAWLWYLRTSLDKKLQALKAEHTWVDRSIRTPSPIRTPWVLLRSAALNCTETESYMKKIKSENTRKWKKYASWKQIKILKGTFLLSHHPSKLLSILQNKQDKQ